MKTSENSSLRWGEPLERARKAVILVHGRGSSATEIAKLAGVLPSDGVAYLAPSAPGGTWYPNRFLAPFTANEPALSRALALIARHIDEAAAAGITLDRIGLIGFSQGACLALEYAARHPGRYAFVAALSGALPGPIDAPARQGDLGGTPVLIGCAEEDAHIPLEHVEKSVRELGAMRGVVTKQLFSGTAHTVFPQEVRWLEAQLSRPA